FLNPLIVPGLSAVYGNELNPQDLFDAVLGLLSATSYTTRFAHDLEDDFPHVPLPADPALFERIARLGRRIRELETFAEAPAQGHCVARFSGRGAGRILDMPTPQRAYVAEAGTGEIALLADRSFRISNVSERVWQFSVSGYSV